MKAAVRYLQTLIDAEVEAGLSDRQLLDHFIAHGDGASLDALVHRHAAMVLGVCRRVLRDHHDAEDAFQATFLVLARRAAVTPRDKVGNWLYGVAYQTALKARAMRAKRRLRESDAAVGAEPEATASHSPSELAEWLDHELRRLPDKYRTPIVLCELEGKTHGEAAERLGWPVGTVSGRLSRAKALLAKRLARRGFTLAGGALAAVLSSSECAMSAGLLSSTTNAAVVFAAGRAVTAGAASAEVAALAKEVLKTMRNTMLISKMKLATAALVLLTLAGAGVWQARTWADGKAPADESFRVAVNDVIREDSIVVTQIAIEAPPGSKIELTSDTKKGNSVLTADVPNRPSGSPVIQLVFVADQFDGKKGEPGTVKFLFSYKVGGISGSSSSSVQMPADAKDVSAMLSAPIKSGDYKLGQPMNLVTFQRETFTLVVTKPK